MPADDDVVPTIIVHIAGEQYRVAGIRPYLVPKNAQDLLLKHHVFIPPRTIIPKKRRLPMLPARIYVKNLADFKSFFRARPMRRAQNAPGRPAGARALPDGREKTGKMIAE